jgi:ketosteroid isomerase-like protein
MFPHLPPRISVQQRDVEITSSGDLAVSHCITRLVNADTNENAAAGWVRVTVCYQRQQGAWRVIHEHVSVPFDPMTGKATFTPEP